MFRGAAEARRFVWQIVPMILFIHILSLPILDATAGPQTFFLNQFMIYRNVFYNLQSKFKIKLKF